MSAAQAELRCEVEPLWPFRLPRAGTDGVARRRGDVLERLIHVGSQSGRNSGENSGDRYPSTSYGVPNRGESRMPDTNR